MIICIMSGVEPLSQSRNFMFLDQPCPIAHDNDIGIFLFHQLRFFLPSVKIFLSISRDFFLPSETRPLRHGFCIGYFPFCIGYFPFSKIITIGIFLFHQLGFFSPSETRPYGTVSASDTFPFASDTFPSASDTFHFQR